MGRGTGTGGSDDRDRTTTWTGLMRSKSGSGGSRSRGSRRSRSTESRTARAAARRERRAARRESIRRFGVGGILKLTALSLLVLLTILVCLLTAWWLLILISLVFLTIYLPLLLYRPGGGSTSGTEPTQPSPLVTLQVGGIRWTFDRWEDLWQHLEADTRAERSTSMSVGRLPPFPRSSWMISKSDESASDESRSPRSPTTLRKSFDL